MAVMSFGPTDFSVRW